MMAIVFQYGSNCDTQWLNSSDRLCGDANIIEIVSTVDNFELDFTVFSKTNHCAAADIVPHSGRRIWGVLYNIPDHLIKRETAGQRKSLDAIEGEGINYQSTTINIQRSDETTILAITYIAKAPRAGLKTSLKYVEHIIKGLRMADAPIDYIDYVKKRVVENNPDLKDSIALL